MNKSITKSKIQKYFSKSINSYNDHALVQAEMAEQLIEYILQSTYNRKFDDILEFGCGSGILTKLLIENFEHKNLTTNDIIELKTQVAKHIKFLHGDIENIELETTYDLITSNAALQWLSDLPAFFDKVANSLNSNGIFAFSSFGEHNLMEIKNLTNNGLTYSTNKDLQAMLSDNFNILSSFEYLNQLNFATPLDVLKHIKATGVGATNDNSTWTKNTLHDFCQAYQQKFTTDNNQVQLTYHPMIIVAEKRSK